VNRREAVSWIGLSAGMSQDGQRGLAQFNFETSKPPDSSKESWHFDKDGQDFGEKKNPLKPHANP
jgi:hypothetical protein